jgi:hypothetical protein
MLALLLALVASRPSLRGGHHLLLEPVAFGGVAGRVVTIVAPPPALSALAVAAGELPARMLCDLTSVDLDACFGNETTTCALPAGACLTADEIALQGVGASLAHAALLARDKAGDTTSAESDDGTARPRPAPPPSAGAPPSPESSPARSSQVAASLST